MKKISLGFALTILTFSLSGQTRLKEIVTTTNTILAEYHAGHLNNRLVTTASGLKAYILDKGEGDSVEEGDLVDAHYYTALPDGKEYDNSYLRKPLRLKLGVTTIIKGYEEATLMLSHGGSGIFFLPPALTYGNREGAALPPNTELILYLEVL